MKFNCKEISISDEDLGCEITFSEKEDLGEYKEKMSFDDMIKSIGKYLLLQRTFSEGDWEGDYCYFETHDDNLLGELEAFEIVMTRKTFKLQLDSEIIEISINPTEKEYSELKSVLPIILNKTGKVTIEE